MEILLGLTLILMVVAILIALAVYAPRHEPILPKGERGSSEFATELPQTNLRPPLTLGYWANLDELAIWRPAREPERTYSSVTMADAFVGFPAASSNSVAKPTSTKSVPASDTIRYSGEGHILTVGATRSGKGVGAIIPNLLTYEGSIIVIDPKGENARATAKRRRQMGQDVLILDPWNISGQGSSSYNPLHFGRDDKSLIVEEARLIADALVVPSLAANQIFWEEEARNGLAAVLMHLLCSQATADFMDLRKLISLGKADFDSYFRKHLLNSSDLDGVIARGAVQLLEKSPAEFSGVLTTMRQNTSFLDAPPIRDVTNNSEFRFSALKKAKITVYLILPPWRELSPNLGDGRGQAAAV